MGRPGSPGPRAGVGDRQRRAAEPGTPLGGLAGACPQSSSVTRGPLSSVTVWEEDGAVPHRPHPLGSPSCFLPEVRQDLDARVRRAGGPAAGRARPACVPTGIFQGRGAGLATVEWASFSSAALVSGSITIRCGPQGRKQLQAAVCAPRKLPEEGWTEDRPLTQLTVGPLCSTSPRVRRALPVLS